MIVKVCGMRDPDNIAALQQISGVDWMGMIFHPSSPRAVNRTPEQLERSFQNLPAHGGHFPEDQSPLLAKPARKGLQRVGVFVDQPTEAVRATAISYRLDRIQLHGSESPEYCAGISRLWPVIKAFRIRTVSDFEAIAGYESVCSHFLFDAAGPQPGGNGISFNWRLLDAYQGSTPFLLAGGLGPDDAQRLSGFQHPAWAGVDLNSGFEIAPGVKDFNRISRFLNQSTWITR